MQVQFYSAIIKLSFADNQIWISQGRFSVKGRNSPMGYYNMQRPEARGEITLKSADPFAHPAIQPNYLQNKTDLRTLRDASKSWRGFSPKGVRALWRRRIHARPL